MSFPIYFDVVYVGIANSFALSLQRKDTFYGSAMQALAKFFLPMQRNFSVDGTLVGGATFNKKIVAPMNKKACIQKIWEESFDNSAEWVDMYFDRVYTDSNGLVLEIDGEVVSSLILNGYDFRFHGRDVRMGYVARAATRQRARGKGYMTELIREAIAASYERGDMLCSLIPAHPWLYDFYSRTGFSTVFYVDMQRFTALHAFSGSDCYSQVEDTFSTDVSDAMLRMEKIRGCGVLHSRRDFLNILDDLRLTPEDRFIAMQSQYGEICSMAWAIRSGDVVDVRELLSIDPQAANAALRELRKEFPDTAFRIWAPATSSHRRLIPRGMARIVDVKQCLSVMADANPGWRSVIRVHDPLIEANNHTFAVENGTAEINDSYSGPMNYDIDIDIFNRLIFRDKSMSEILDIPTVRPHLSLMLD